MPVKVVVNKCYSLPGSLLSSIYKGIPPGIGPVFVIYYNCIFMLHYCVYFLETNTINKRHKTLFSVHAKYFIIINFIYCK